VLIQLKLLERELIIQTKNQHSQSDKMKSYKTELTEVKSVMLNRERENENLVKKMADLTIKNNLLVKNEEPLRKRLEQLDTLNKTLSSQIEDLKKSRVTAKKDGLETSSFTEKQTPVASLPDGLYELLTEIADNKTIGVNYSLKIKSCLQGLNPPDPKKPKGKDLAFLNSISQLKRVIQGTSVLNDKVITQALDTLKTVEFDANTTQSLNVIFTKLATQPLSDSSKDKKGTDSAYKPGPEKFENTSVLQMKYEDLKKSSETEIQRLNNHVKILMEKFEASKEKKLGDKATK
jgi:hypothetical protein